MPRRFLQAAGRQLSPQCSSSVLRALARPSRSSDSRRSLLRFQEGAVDEVSFLGAELGPLASLLIGPECGAWSVEEITVGSSRTRHTDRCSQLLTWFCFSSPCCSSVPLFPAMRVSCSRKVLCDAAWCSLLHSTDDRDERFAVDQPAHLQRVDLSFTSGKLCISLGIFPCKS